MYVYTYYQAIYLSQLALWLAHVLSKWQGKFIYLYIYLSIPIHLYVCIYVLFMLPLYGDKVGKKIRQWDVTIQGNILKS